VEKGAQAAPCILKIYVFCISKLYFYIFKMCMEAGFSQIQSHIDLEKVEDMRNIGMSLKKISETLGISRSTLYKTLGLVELESWPLCSEDWVGCSPKALITPLNTLATVEGSKQTFGTVIFLTSLCSYNTYSHTCFEYPINVSLLYT